MIPDAEFSRLLVAAMPDIARFARGRCRDRDAAADLAQDTLELAWRNRDKYERGNFTGWCIQICSNRFIDFARRRKLRQVEPMNPPSGAPHEITFAVEGRQEPCIALREVMAMVRALSGRRRAILAGSLNGESYTQMAERMGVPSGTIRSNLFRARRALENASDPPELSQFCIDMAMERRRELLEAQR